jgi:hypothetical protein
LCVPAHKLAQRIAEGVDAKETVFFQREGRVIETRDVIAWGERRRYVQLAAQYGQYVQPGKPDVSVTTSLILISGVSASFSSKNKTPLI